ncbi:phage tail assembly chaperone [Pseudomonas sp. UBA4034]|uniref:phage tail assembly chaperone n=1 Tax=Pseudomonas sp. UBA4034 TaxID=1947315 RepID=UPI00257DA4B4|nr:phage tail assembly chaperone [Pseudomonas sp. UBA4034]
MAKEKAFVPLDPPLVAAVADGFDLQNIRRRSDGSYVVICNGYPFHVTESETPDIFAIVTSAIDGGAEVTDAAEDSALGPTAAELARSWRDAALDDVVWLRERHRDERELDIPTSISAAHFAELLTYIQALRDWPQTSDFPGVASRPVQPEWVNEIIASNPK